MTNKEKMFIFFLTSMDLIRPAANQVNRKMRDWKDNAITAVCKTEVLYFKASIFITHIHSNESIGKLYYMTAQTSTKNWGITLLNINTNVRKYKDFLNVINIFYPYLNRKLFSKFLYVQKYPRFWILEKILEIKYSKISAVRLST